MYYRDIQFFYCPEKENFFKDTKFDYLGKLK